ncbi:unnamed protein product [Brachionus calyciflorus]|uniref:UPAR/Ly6 domain-containing protein n=1 Tax=Brachionus calyciflorus TaxID=104777 RepID=A0A814NJQ3_9BILA|nr:unnamed protein product [Brachionus calyciflorus]
MNKSLFFVLSVSFALIAFPFQNVNALKCYEGAGGVYVSNTCTTGLNACQKIETNTFGVITTAKACVSNCVSGTVAIVTTSCCTTDNCNSSTSIISSSVLLAFSLLSAIWVKLH